MTGLIQSLNVLNPPNAVQFYRALQHERHRSSSPHGMASPQLYNSCMGRSKGRRSLTSISAALENDACDWVN